MSRFNLSDFNLSDKKFFLRKFSICQNAEFNMSRFNMSDFNLSSNNFFLKKNALILKRPVCYEKKLICLGFKEIKVNLSLV